MAYKILIVDDFKVSNEIISAYLENKGYKTYSYQKGSEALKFLKMNKVDLIITDYIMPEMDGLMFLSELRNLPGYEETPVIFLSSSRDTSVIKVAYKYNISAWLNKPVDIEQIGITLDKIFKK